MKFESTYKTLHKIYEQHRRNYKENPDSKQMCCMWSTDDPPDVIEDTEPFNDIEAAFNITIDDDFALELYDMDLEDATNSIIKIKQFQTQLSSFIKKVKELNNPSFTNPEEWTLCHDLYNGVSIESKITDEADRKLLHKIGQQYGLIPLCPNEVVGLDLAKDGKINFAVVETAFGRLKIDPPKDRK